MKTTENPDYNEVQLYDAQPNKMFPDWMTRRMRFLRYHQGVKCACCGKVKKHHWTMLISFRASIFGKHFGVLKSEPPVHLPLTPVCRDHPLDPCMPKRKK